MKYICLIEHQRQLNARLCRLLAQPGVTVTAFTSATPALEHIAAEPPDLAIVELFLPDPDGIETLLALRDRLPDLPIIVLVGQPNRLAIPAVNLALKLGANSAVQAPLCVSQLFAVVNRVLQSSSAFAGVV